MLELERRTYEEKLPELLKMNSGRFVLIKEDQVVDTFDTMRDALRAGYRKFGSEPIFVHEISPVEEPLNFANHYLFT